MSLLLLNDPFDYPVRPSRILDQHFGLGLGAEDLLAPLVPRELRNLVRAPGGYFRPWRSMASRQDSGSTVSVDKDKFQVNLDVQQFKPEEITVKVTGENVVTVEGKHEEKEDEHGFISRHFVRKYVLPKGHDIDRIESKLSSDGVLTISAPKIAAEKCEYRNIPITQTGQPSKPAVVEKKNEVNEKGEIADE
ncbi:HSP20 and/or Crystallin domain containing protein [Asbolus verrucosus]|uniref:HSP20 and/or Crystallin domain containing protein n=1 Tax=Asbolus verrucosus TaxID=1661398 RepID=A0A482W5G3_ASBVE|nr:HSP20 and/or Crystallin domain containing protein [Asbolus verrucosus]